MPTPLRVGKLANCINTGIKKLLFLRKTTTDNRYLLGNVEKFALFSSMLKNSKNTYFQILLAVNGVFEKMWA